jgi:hypothetical protein
MRNRIYEDMRNSFIPEAEKYANKLNGKNRKGRNVAHDVWADKWNKDFHGMMNELVKKKLKKERSTA